MECRGYYLPFTAMSITLLIGMGTIQLYGPGSASRKYGTQKGGEQHVVEIKIWRSREYHERGELQIAGYLDDYHKELGYLLSFNFNKNKQIGIKEIVVGNKLVIEAVV